MNYFYLFGEEYADLADFEGNVPGPCGMFLWSIWCVEWLLNAYIWVLLAGFSLLTIWTLRKFRFKSLDQGDARRRLQDIAAWEGVPIEDGALDALIKCSEGDLRKAITFLQSSARLVGASSVNGDGDDEMEGDYGENHFDNGEGDYDDGDGVGDEGGDFM